MNQEELQEFARRQPFQPFRVILTTGGTYAVRHPDLIMVGRRSTIIGITNEPNATAYDRTIKVDLLHVVGIEELPVSPPSSNGPPEDHCRDRHSGEGKISGWESYPMPRRPISPQPHP